MKLEFIKRGAATRLILIFAGWSTDARYYNDCMMDGWDTAVLSDYRDLTMPPVPAHYSTVYVFAYSLGVAAAALCDIKASVCIAVNGSIVPVSDRFGIPVSVYQGTQDSLDERQLLKFHMRMAGSRKAYADIANKLPVDPDLNRLKEELKSIRDASLNAGNAAVLRFDRAYISYDDRIFPYVNLKSFWEETGVDAVTLFGAPHSVDLKKIIYDCLPDTMAIREGFSRSYHSYKENAVIQKEICARMTDILRKYMAGKDCAIRSLVEIGPGSGLFTDEWSGIIAPEEATFVDLTETPRFGIATDETYIIADAEEWMEEIDKKFDVILSSSTIQWFVDPVRFIDIVRSHLNPGGIGIISTFVKGNLCELDSLRPCPIIYHSTQEYLSAGVYRWEAWSRTLRFESARDMMMHLRLTGVSPRRHKSKDAKRTAGSDTGRKLASLPTELTYRPMILVVKA